MKKLLFLVNPVSGAQAGSALALELDALMRARLPGGQYDIVLTTPDVTAQARALAGGYETIVAAGGDGTISRIAQGVLQLSARPRLGLVPLGTGNDFARALGLLEAYRAGGLVGLVDIFLAGQTQAVDMLELGSGHVFKSYAGFGRDAAIAEAFNRLRLREPCRWLCGLGWGKLLYLLLGIANSRRRLAPGFELTYVNNAGVSETRSFAGPACQLMITNIPTYGGGTVISSRCRMDDGKFEVTVVKSGLQWALLHLARIIGTPYDRIAPGVCSIQTSQLSFSLGAPVCWQLDGETQASSATGPFGVRVVDRLEMITAPC